MFNCNQKLGVHASGKELRAWMCGGVCARACERAYPWPCVREGAERCVAARCAKDPPLSVCAPK